MPTLRRESALPPPVEFAVSRLNSTYYARLTRTVAVVVFCTLFAPSLAFAQSAEAGRLIEQGLTLRERGEHQAALSVFERAARIEPTPRTTAQIALAHHALGHYRIAREKLIESISQSRDNWIRTRLVALQEAQLDCEQHLARIRIEGGEAGDVVFVGDEERATLPLSEVLYNEPGEVTFRLKRNGEFVGAMRAQMVANAEAVVRFDIAVAGPVLATAATAEPLREPDVVTTSDDAEAATDSTPMSWRTPVGWTAIGLGVAGLATGVAFNVMRENVLADYTDASCDRTWADGCESKFDNGATYKTALLAGYITGGVLVAAGVVLLLLPNSDSNASTAHVQCAPLLGQVSGVTCGGEF